MTFTSPAPMSVTYRCDPLGSNARSLGCCSRASSSVRTSAPSGVNSRIGRSATYRLPGLNDPAAEALAAAATLTSVTIAVASAVLMRLGIPFTTFQFVEPNLGGQLEGPRQGFP